MGTSVQRGGQPSPLNAPRGGELTSLVSHFASRPVQNEPSPSPSSRTPYLSQAGP